MKWWWDAECRLVWWMGLGVDDGAQAREIYMEKVVKFTQHNIYHLFSWCAHRRNILPQHYDGIFARCSCRNMKFPKPHSHTITRESALRFRRFDRTQIGDKPTVSFLHIINTMVNGKIKSKTRYRWERLNWNGRKIVLHLFSISWTSNPFRSVAHVQFRMTESERKGFT